VGDYSVVKCLRPGYLTSNICSIPQKNLTRLARASAATPGKRLGVRRREVVLLRLDMRQVVVRQICLCGRVRMCVMRMLRQDRMVHHQSTA
jgi:hypothetical protein